LQPEIVTYNGYQSEIHAVTTDDGYVLELHRIPAGKSAIGRSARRYKFFVFLFVVSSNLQIRQFQGFLFADAGFDVWMGNVRGNKYSTGHVNYTRSNRKYWDFTLIRKFFALGPIGTLGHIKGLVKTAATRFMGALKNQTPLKYSLFECKREDFDSRLGKC
uniref:Abhydro_lipase domain-containing protein n=1 Tax=Gongylonema pulchrum TaxID=637853 RepID=A0A183E0E6_9BILA